MATIGNPYGGVPGYGAPSQQQMMAQKLMEMPEAPKANSSAESAGANTLAQSLSGGLRGATAPKWDEASQKWVQNNSLQDLGKWFSGLFGSGGGDQTGMGAGAGVGGLY